FIQLIFGTPFMCATFVSNLSSCSVVGSLLVDSLSTLITPTRVLILMVVIGFFSILVTTATPVGKIPDRIIGAYRWRTGQDVVAENETAAVEATESQRTHADHDQSYLYEHDRQPKQKKTRPGFFARLFGAKD